MEHSIRRLERLVALSALVLLALTWPLWAGAVSFPRVPLFRWGTGIPFGVDQGLAGLLIVALVSVVAVSFVLPSGVQASRIRRAAAVCALAATVGLVLLDQHRWQTWVWQFFLYAVVFATAPPSAALRLLRLFVVGLYFHSAVSKLDHAFLVSHGPELVDGLLANVTLALPRKGPVRAYAALVLPVGELVVAGLLAFGATRRLGLWLSFLMHGALLLALGPGGLNHHPGVLAWNLFFIVQNGLLFGAIDGHRSSERWKWTATFRSATFAGALIGAVTVLPVFDWFGRLDPWLGWGLYASRTERLRMYVREPALKRLPAELAPFIEPPAPLEDWRRLRLDRWSLAATGAPISPQVRFSFAVALSLARTAELQDDVRIDRESTASRWSGRRSFRELAGEEAMESARHEFLLNVEPR